MGKKVLGVYNSNDEVITAVEELRNDGYSVKDLSILANTHTNPTAVQYETGVPTEEFNVEVDNDKDHKGFIDSLVSAFEGDHNTGENQGSYYDRLVGCGIDEDAAREYEGDIKDGRILLLSNSTNNTRVADSNTRTEDTRGLYSDSLGTETEQSLKLREEKLDVTKERVQTGEVEVHKDVVEEQKTINVPVTREEVYVERREVNETATDDSFVGDDETIRVPIVEEKVEVTKKPVVTEELVIGKRQVQETEQVTENIKREEANVDTDGDAIVDDTNRRDSRLDNNKY